MNEIILDKLAQIEKEHHVKILYALESGSRGWGFASKDSDYDVRFIYVHPTEHYLSLDPKRDVIEYPISDQLDINGWDIKKALILFYRCNPTLYEWLDSPITYIDQGGFKDALKSLVPAYFSGKACYHHYLSMLMNNYADYSSKQEIKMKKYFYVLRPVFACLWIKKNDSMPPMLFEKLMDAQVLTADLREQIDTLLIQKKKGDEQDLQPRIEMIDAFIRQNIVDLEAFAETISIPEKRSYDALNRLFQEFLRETYR